MTHQRFQLDFNEGSFEVQFNLEFDGDVVNVTTLQIHSTIKPQPFINPSFELENGQWGVYSNYQTLDAKKNIINVRQKEDSKIAIDIANKILKIKEDETPRFTN
ncbi:MAG: hypothetical protein JNN00_17695 [Chitinophagaceae bacterium]|nr:hypothetical protein [Chitinophagaceae bacterium]